MTHPVIINTIITSYKVSDHHHPSGFRSSIHGYTDNEKVSLVISFYNEGDEIHSMRIDDMSRGKYRVVIYYPIHMLQHIHHLLQTEKPIRLYANRNHMGYVQAVFGTLEEEVGETVE